MTRRPCSWSKEIAFPKLIYCIIRVLHSTSRKNVSTLYNIFEFTVIQSWQSKAAYKINKICFDNNIKTCLINNIKFVLIIIEGGGKYNPMFKILEDAYSLLDIPILYPKFLQWICRWKMQSRERIQLRNLKISILVVSSSISLQIQCKFPI